ncbi:phospho-N-acetylmuramoyl-pentapeptide-transferase [Sulfurimonas sp. MAG313]|nr:phospho-N-acetylmuramoyl-pentapeptide-transferase [Sulfurimonas sp. MAG313]MDF1880740.1 phospho-N-acetylmuramoyl-pentapeptide-transferase [Sulfurimonas sp. MAG313]
MLYWLYRHLDINIFQYITVRAGFAFFFALVITIFVMPRFIKWAQNRWEQPINDYAPDTHQHKAKTPTMGGIIFIGATLIATVLTAKLNSHYVVGGLLTLALFSLIGLQDDLSKVLKNENRAGLSAKVKLLFQMIAAGIVGLYLCYYADFNTDLYLPFFKNPLFDMGPFAILFWIFVMVGTSNAVNLTDGLDGLASVPSIFSLLSLSVIVYITGHAIISKYLLLPNFPVGEVVIIAAALMGSITGFLWFNCHPAEVFMGDSGSLTIGAFIAYMGIIGKSEVLLVVIGLIFVIETVSVILQVGSYKLRQKRVFLMAPIHHHFEMKKWHENKIIVRFWIISMLSNLIALISLKIR